MERNALLLYLKNIRDLEFAQIKIQKRINEYNSSFSKKIDSLCQTDYATLPEKPSKHTNGPFLILLGIGLELLCVYMTLIEKSGHPYRIDSNKIGFHYLSMYESSPGFASFLFLSMTAISIFLIHLGANKIKSSKDELKEYEQLLPACIEHNKNEDIRLEKNQQLMDTLIQADEASKAKSRFLARMSHEIRTPMNAIVGLTEIAKKHLTDPNRIEQYLSKIDSASHVLLNIINDVLDMSAIKNNKLKIAHEKFDMKKIINSITAIYYNQCKQKGIKLEVISACLTHEILIGDSLRVNQIILNLISNASKFTPAGGKIRFEITEKAYKKQTIFIRIIVSDTGIGMTPEMLTRLFNTFEQENANTAQQYGGSGLGLSIVKNLVELMHGSISVESKKGVGSMFTVDLPFSIPEIDELSSSKSINDLRVLVVDNDCASRIYMTSILDRINVQYDIATTTEQTVKMLSTADKAGKHYDICFIDCKASFADSITLTKNIRKIYDKKALVIILSAYDISEIGENMETSGADIFLQKPLFQSTVFNMLISLTDKNYIKGTFHKESKESYDFHGKKVLLAEDNALNTEIAIELLNSVNLNVDHAENGQIAVDKI